jgi:hypothetical protein
MGDLWTRKSSNAMAPHKAADFANGVPTVFALGLRVWRKLSDRLMGVVAGFCSIRSTRVVYEGLASGQSGIGKTWRLPVCRFVDPPERRQADRRRTKTTRL